MGIPVGQFGIALPCNRREIKVVGFSLYFFWIRSLLLQLSFYWAHVSSSTGTRAVCESNTDKNPSYCTDECLGQNFVQSKMDLSSGGPVVLFREKIPWENGRWILWYRSIQSSKATYWWEGASKTSTWALGKGYFSVLRHQQQSRADLQNFGGSEGSPIVNQQIKACS